MTTESFVLVSLGPVVVGFCFILGSMVANRIEEILAEKSNAKANKSSR